MILVFLFFSFFFSYFIFSFFFFFFFNDTATTEIYTLSLHDALPICYTSRCSSLSWSTPPSTGCGWAATRPCIADRKSTRLNSSHLVISYAVFCLKKKKQVPEVQTLPETQKGFTLPQR